MEISSTELRNTRVISVPFVQSYSVGTHSFIVPSGITHLRVTANGAGGGSSSNSIGGKGASITTIVPVTPLQTLYVIVGSRGLSPASYSSIGFGGIGGTSSDVSKNGSSGGGLTGIFTESSYNIFSSLVIAGGGGGAGGGPNSHGGNAGIVYPGNAFDGSDRTSGFGYNGGRGGTLISGGIAGTTYDPQSVSPTVGGPVQGGRGGSVSSSSWYGGGGGGSGYYGGGGGAGGGDATGGGGGGSSYSVGDILFSSTPVNAGTDGSILVEAVVLSSPISFNYTGSIQTWQVPRNVKAVKVLAIGAAGGDSVINQSPGVPRALGGSGGIINSIVPVTPNSTLNIVVGGYSGNSATAVYGYGGNGGTQDNIARSGSAGGGLTGIFNGDVTIANAIVVAGGGGGATTINTQPRGGDGGATSAGDGNDGVNASTDWPGTQGRGGKTSTSTGGAAGTNRDTQAPGQGPTAGTTIQGGRGGRGNRTTDYGGGGGGAGAYSGGGGSGGGHASGGGGGGSSYTITAATNYTEIGTTSSTVYNYTGALQEYIVPSNVNQLRVTAIGASGGAINTNDVPGSGANITSVVNVTPGSTVYVYVGRCPGRSYFTNIQLSGVGMGSSSGAGVGGLGGAYYDTTVGISVFGGGGGGLSGVFTSNVLTQANALIVAGGGGGASSSGTSYKGGNGGTGPLGTGQNGSGGIGVGYGRGGTTSAGGAAGTVDAAYPNQIAPLQGQPLYGGSAGSRSVSVPGTTGYGGGGGGAGYYGGGGGVSGGPTNRQGGGGGGSSWSSNATITYNSTLNGNLQHGKVLISPIIQRGNGFMLIEQIC